MTFQSVCSKGEKKLFRFYSDAFDIKCVYVRHFRDRAIIAEVVYWMFVLSKALLSISFDGYSSLHGI